MAKLAGCAGKHTQTLASKLRGLASYVKTEELSHNKIQSRMIQSTTQFASSFRASWQALASKLPKNAEDLKNLRPQELIDNASQFFSQGSVGTYLRIGTTVAVAYFLADTASLFTDSLIPDPPILPPPPVAMTIEKKRSIEEFTTILKRNIFSSAGLIPEDTVNINTGGPARKTSLPLALIGTVVLNDPSKSIATIDDKGQNQIIPVRVEETVNSKITIKKIEHLKVTFINLATGGLEYIDLPDDILNNVTVSSVSKSGSGPIEKEGDHVNIQRTELEKAFGNINEVLTQARAIPNFENGMPAGFKIIQIVPGSIYTKLGINENDVLMAVNSDPMNDPGKAFQMMNELRSGASHLELQIKGPGGRVRTMNYDVR